MDYESLLELLKNRRSIRRYKSDRIPDEYVDRIIEAARLAPSGFNTQPWEFVIIKKKELKDEIAKLVHDYRSSHYPLMEKRREPWQKDRSTIRRGGAQDWSNAPVFILILGDTRANAGLPMAVRFHDKKCQSIFTSSLANALLYMHLAATTLGLASQWISPVQVPFVQASIRELIGIPVELEVYDMMAVGYGASKARAKFLRSQEEMIHYDDCGEEDFRTDEEVKEFIRRTRAWAIATINRKVDE
jgi:nitroreductase